MKEEKDKKEDIEVVELKDEAQAELPAHIFKYTEAVANNIYDGMTETEALLMLNIPDRQWLKFKKMYPIIQRVIDIKKLEFKKSIIRPMLSNARSLDGGTSGTRNGVYILESLFPEEFGKQRGSGNNTDDLLAEAVKFAQDNEDNHPLVRSESSSSSSDSSEESDVIKKVEDILA